MLLTLLQFFATKFLFLALHLESGCFPRPLTAREEAAAFSALRAGDAAAREKLIRHNLRLVAHIVKKYYALPGDQEDLVSIGTIGLMKAVDTFDATRKARFSTLTVGHAFPPTPADALKMLSSPQRTLGWKRESTSFTQ